MSPGPRPVSIRTKWHIDPASRLDTTNVGRKLGVVPLLGKLGLHLTQCRLGEAYLRTKWHLYPSSRLATAADIGRKLGDCASLREELGPF